MKTELTRTELELKIMGLLKTYGANVKAILGVNPKLEYLYALSPQRENLLEWYPFRKEGRLLQVGSDYGAITGLYASRVAHVDVLDESWMNLEINRVRHVEEGHHDNITYVQGTLGAYVAQTEYRYDYVVMVGDMGRDHWSQEELTEQIRSAKKILKADGRLIMAVSNPFGVKYWAGADKGRYNLSKTALVRLLSERENGGDLEFYYPMPDYKIPMVIYSDAYLPQEGDMADMVIAYDFPDYPYFNMGDAYDEICRDGKFDQFANSYIVIWSPDAGEKLQLAGPQYMKYNRTRSEKFQLKTTIFGGRAKRYVKKSALTEDGAAHIHRFDEHEQQLSEQHELLKFSKALIKDEGRTAEFPYLVGRTLASQMWEEIRGGEDPTELVRQTIDVLLAVKESAVMPFIPTDEFAEVFGARQAEALERGLPSLSISNIDLLFENVLLTDDGMYCLDYEWVYDFPIPVEFIRYRILFYAYRQMQGMIPDCDSLAEWLSRFDITPEKETIFGEMERSFQYYVHGENQVIFLENYLTQPHEVQEFIELQREIARHQENEDRLRAQLHDQSTTIRKMTEVKRLTDNHVANLEIIIRDQSNEINELGKTLTYLSGHEALIFKIRRKLGEKFNARYPKGSKERKRLRYRTEYFLHPIRSFKLYRTEEGKNLRAGDFEIGEIYREHGKLKFAEVSEPLVSIIIPVYNQVEYTYKCLLSILEYTEDVSYEVIIADDVSADATSHLDRYVQGVTISRNETNQGFLKNCNQAAKKARGKYLMFLNNDTQVTEKWLRTLVDLIESDRSIGMVGSKLVYPDGRLQEAGGIIWSDGSGWNYGRLDDPNKPEYNYVKEVDYISGAAILLPNELWQQIGGFDERYAPAYCEDSDLAFEVRKAGYRVMYQPLSKVIHFEGVSNGTDVNGEGLKRYQVENSEKLKEKWADELKWQCENTGNPDPFRARERSMGKPILLVVDHYVPTFDKDAGSKTTYQYLKMFLKQGFVVKFLGDNFGHEEPYSTVLEQMGIEILSGAEYEAGIWDWLSRHGKDIAAAYLNRPHIASKYIDYIRENTDMKIIYYGHDLHFLRESREYALTMDAEKRRTAEYWKAIETSLFYKADMSYYPSYVERDAVLAEDPNLPVKDIVAYVYDEFKENIPQDFAEREGILFVGGFAHPPNADAVLWFAKEVYPQICEAMKEDGKEAPGFYVVGSRVTPEIQALGESESGIVVKGFVSEEELEKLYESTRLVVVPLRYGAGVKGKVVEALYHGAAIVTTSIGAEGIPEAKEVMVIADQAKEFADTVAAIYQDPDACRILSERAQAHVRQYYSMEAAWNVIAEDFDM